MRTRACYTELWSHLTKINNELLARSGHGDISAQELFEMVNRRVRVQSDRAAENFEPNAPGSHHPFAERTRVPKAHLILSRLQIGEGISESIKTQLREGGAAWSIDEHTSPESFTDHFETRELKTSYATHFAARPKDGGDKQRFLGQVHFRVFTFMIAHNGRGAPPANPEVSPIYRNP